MKSLAKPHPRTTLLWGQCALEAISCGKCNGSVPAISRPLSRCFPLSSRPAALRLVCADVINSAQWTIAVPCLHLLTRCRQEAKKGRGAGGDHAHPQALLLPRRHRASVGGTGSVVLRFWLSTRLLSMKDEATDRFMGDTIRFRHCWERFVLLHHTMHHCWPWPSGKTVCRLLWPWTPLLAHRRRRASLGSFLFSKQGLDLLIESSSRGKEERANW
jgi:hypothetical protein